MSTSRSPARPVQLVVGALMLGLTVAPGPLPAQTSITIYNDGRTLVRWTQSAEIPRGSSRQVAVTGAADPGSIFSLDPDLTIVSSTYDAGTDEMSAVRRSIGRRVTYRSGKDTVSAVILGVDPVRYQLADGTVSFVPPGLPQYPADVVTVDPRYELTIVSARARKGLPLGYFAAGAAWSASYQVILGGGGTARVMGQAVVNPGPLRFKETEIQLLAGQVNVAPAAAPYPARAEGLMVMKAAEAAAPPAEEKVGEFHLYTLPGTWSLDPGIVRTISLFEPTEAPVRKSFELRGRLPYWGGLPQYGEEEAVPVRVVYTVERARKSDLGGRPLPAGTVRLFEPDSAGRVELIGESRIDHSPAGEDLRLDAGTAFDLTAKRVQTSYVTRRDSTGQNGVWRTIATADYRVTLTNAGPVPATVEVLEERGGEWAIVSSSLKPEKLSSTRTRFRVPVVAGGKATLTYRVRVVW
jgi:hypothetical protein